MNRKRKAILIAAGAAGAFIGANAFVATRFLPRRDRIKRGKKLVLCIGDSITFGAGVAWTRGRDAWPFILQRLLGSEYQVLNYGISGATAQKGTDCPYRERFLQSAVSVHAETVLLMLGTNDSKPHNWDPQRYEAAVHELVSALREEGTTIFLLLPPKAFPGKDGVVGFKIQDETIRKEILPILFRVAEEEDCPVIDLYSFTEEHPEYFGDGVHPNRLGNIRIAEYLAGELKP
ncbi:MAG: hypothetical protein IKR59_08250 [Lachnospiraceae bacterium]|nr:hypothetical protein [Lachnospiraceae bacterium]